MFCLRTGKSKASVILRYILYRGSGSKTRSRNRVVFTQKNSDTSFCLTQGKKMHWNGFPPKKNILLIHF